MQGITKSGGRHGLGFVEECEDRAAERTKIILDIRHLLDPSIVNIQGVFLTAPPLNLLSVGR